ncbi:MAG TPA: Crp/Fnr family transcriptional regulator [Firmicutes bacterium]|jgi:CRP-like cAMP-binding protein|nr:Crp/Fnr family transcriptional regulator [Bacillota bacterium]
MELNLLKKIIDANPELYPIFRGCPYEILSHWEINEYQAGTVICRQGEIIERMYIIINGYADIYYLAENGKKYSLITLKNGDVIGEIEILDKRPYSANMEAYSDLKTVEISRDYFLQWMEMDRNINLSITRILSSRFYHLVLKAGKDTLYTLKYRLCAYLISRGKQISKENVNVEIKLKKEKLSEEFGVTSRSVSRILCGLQNKNIIELRVDSILIKDFKKLAKEEECYDL